jgi:hypothetical protein
MSTTILLAHLLGLRDTVTRRLREEERGDVLQTIVLILGFFLLAGIVVAVITAAVNNRTAQIN